MAHDDASARRRRLELRSRPKRALAAAALVLAGVGLVGCNTHNVALTRPCRVGHVTRGQPGLPRLGLTYRVWKVQQSC